MSDELHARVDKFERTVATCLCAMPTLFSLQSIAIGLSVPVFRALYQDFGAPLPALSHTVLTYGATWIALGLALPVICLVLARRGSPINSVVVSTLAGVFMFILAGIGTVGLFLPILELGSVTAHLG
jgi:hypothetical protein